MHIFSCFYWKDQSVNSVSDIMTVYCKNDVEYKNTLCGTGEKMSVLHLVVGTITTKL